MINLLLAHAVAALIAPTLVKVLGRRAFWILALAPLSLVLWTRRQGNEILSGAVVSESVTWVPQIGLVLDFRLDLLSYIMALIVGGVGTLVLIYCAAYFSQNARNLGRFAAVLVGFAGAMVGLVTADNLLLLYVFWELTTVFSYLLIGHYHERKSSRRAAMDAIIVTTAGGLAMLAGIIIIGEAAGTYQISAILAQPPAVTSLIVVAVVLLLAGAVTKSALIPTQFWLPAAMAAPTPVSAYLHAAAMVKAGVYLVARFAPAFADIPAWRYVVLILGATTMVYGGYRALRQHDLKLILAFGTVSQLGLLIMLLGHGSQALALAGLVLLIAHALFKAALFLVVGTIDVCTGTRDLRRLSGVGRVLPITATAAGLAVASMVGFPPLIGFLGKESALAALFDSGAATDQALLVGFVLGAILTAAYGLRFWWGAFFTKEVIAANPEVESRQVSAHESVANTPTRVSSAANSGEDAPAPAEVYRPHATLVWPSVVLALTSLMLGIFPQQLEKVLALHADTYPFSATGHLSLWDGITPPLLITVAVLAIAVLLFAFREAVERLQHRISLSFTAEGGYRRFMRRLDDVAADITAATQRGSLPFYLTTILLVFLISAGLALYTVGIRPEYLRAWDHPVQVLFGALGVLAAIMAARSRHRIKAIILAGISGYAVAALYFVHGAPDLALTQTLVETVTLVVFVLVLRRLPAFFSNRPLKFSRWGRIFIALSVGATAATIALLAPSARIHEPASVNFPSEAVAFGNGKNLVNVTLVDIRAWDTMGEISVLLVAATGVASLIFIRGRTGRIFRSSDAEAEQVSVWSNQPDSLAPITATPASGAIPALTTRSRTWLPGVKTVAAAQRSVIFEVVTRLLFHTMILFSLYLLFAGHNQPGGGFVAGLVAGIALAVRYLAAGRYELGEAAPVQPGILLGSGLFLAVGYGLISLLAGLSVLQSTTFDFSLPLIGEVHLVTALFFDVGVYLLVLGLVLDILRSLGAEVDRHIENDAAQLNTEMRGLR